MCSWADRLPGSGRLLQRLQGSHDQRDQNGREHFSRIESTGSRVVQSYVLSRGARLESGAGSTSPRRRRAGSVTVKLAPRPFARALGRHGAAVQLDEVPDDGQPQPEAAVRRAWSRCRPGGSARRRAAGTRARCPAPVSATTTSTGASRALQPRPRTRPPRGRELDGVGEQVPDHLLQPVRRRPGRGRAGARARPASPMPLPRRPGARSRAPPRRRGGRSTAATSSRSLPAMMR